MCTNMFENMGQVALVLKQPAHLGSNSEESA